MAFDAGLGQAPAALRRSAQLEIRARFVEKASPPNAPFKERFVEKASRWRLSGAPFGLHLRSPGASVPGSAVDANRAGTYLAIFRVVAKKYPSKSHEDVLAKLVASTPGDEGKWFAAAKDAARSDAPAVERPQ